jgi:hypothetical protein
MIPEEPDNNVPKIGIAEVLRKLPLCDELYLGMQAINLDIIDAFLEEQEARLLAEYMGTERTPFPTAMFVGALSQMWIFAFYEFFRTWRQRARNVLRWAKEFRSTPPAAREARLVKKRREIEEQMADPMSAAAFYWPAYQQAIEDAVFEESLRKAIDRAEQLFRRIEALRMSLAKHEIPGVKGSYAMAPGYGRIDMRTGSFYWQVVLRGDEVDIISRREIADDCRRLALARDTLILPEDIQDKIKKLPDHSYGVKRIAVTLKDGTIYRGVFVGWSKEVLFVEGIEGVPFDVACVADARNDPLPPK